MSKDLGYCIVYTPKKYNTEQPAVNYSCADKRIHIRFRDFNKQEEIFGFEKKLTYLLSYLMHYSYLKTVPNWNKYDSDFLISNFSRSLDVYNIFNTIKYITGNNNLKGFKLYKNYKKQDCKEFGEVLDNCFPVVTNNNSNESSLEAFLDILNISLVSYLFDDNYKIEIRPIKDAKLNKFERKQIRKYSKNTTKSDLVQLW